MQDVDPVRSREHILLANIFESAWSQGRDLDLGELILQTQNPPFFKLGVFDVNTFFSEKDRFSLAMLLNNILARQPGQVWLEGQPLDIPACYTRLRPAAHSISTSPTWQTLSACSLSRCCSQPWRPGCGPSRATTLRSLLYFDEIFGYLPPRRIHLPSLPMLRV
jgi:hypothetical protein